MSSCLTPEALRALGPGQPPTIPQQEHLATCEVCRSAWRVGLEATVSHHVDEARTPASPPALEAVPHEMPGRYERVCGPDGSPVVLGRGGFARVELARDLVIGRDVALKTLRSQQLTPARRHLSEQRLLQEARVVGQLEHPAIVPLHDLARTADGQLFYAMRRIRGRTLAAAVEEATTLEQRLRLLPHVLATCHALAYAHSRGVVHRDLKPQNVMIDRFGETMVIDWGLARTGHGPETDDVANDPASTGALRLVGDETLSDGRGRLGTPAYMSPEQLTGLRQLIDEKSDVWGLGGILFEVLTGQAPRESGALTAPPPKARALVPELPEDLAALCDHALETSREDRYQSAEALAQDLDAWLHGQRVTAHTYRPLELAKRFVRQHRLTVLVGALATAALLALAVGAAVRVREERNQTRDFALLLAGDVLQRMPFDAHDNFRAELAARVNQWLASSSDEGDPARAAWAWAQLVSDYEIAERFEDARATAARCLEHVARHPSPAPLMQAAALSCRASAIDGRYDVPAPERYRELVELWRTLPAETADSRELLLARTSLATTLSYHASNTSDGEATRGWALQLEALARRRAELEPTESAAWATLSYAQLRRSAVALNALDPVETVALARAGVESARRAHQLGRSGRTLRKLANALHGLRYADRFFGLRVDPEGAAASVAELRHLYEAVLTFDPDDRTARRDYAAELLEEGEIAQGWAVLGGLSPQLEFVDLITELSLALLAGHPDLVLSRLRAERQGEDEFDFHVLFALSLERTGQPREAAAHLRRAAQLAFMTGWPLNTMPRWAAAQAGPSAPALASFATALSRAQRANDAAAAKVALETFASALEALGAP